MAVVLIVLAAVLLVGYLLARFNSLWIYRLLDRAKSNPRGFLHARHELPRYFRLGANGVDLTSRWPGWDGWYFFVIPAGEGSDIKMIRASIMTGLYGLDGIDDYRALPAGVSSFHAIEYLNFVPMLQAPGQGAFDGSGEAGGGINHLSHDYDLKECLELSVNELSVSSRMTRAGQSGSIEKRGSIQGKWPEYRFSFSDGDTGIDFELDYQGQDLVWWADIPGVFTYFAAFGAFTGTLTVRPGLSEDRLAEPQGAETYPIKGFGAFEHGFARKIVNYDWAYRPARWLRRIVPSFRPVRYHYQLLIGENGFHGGLMFASGFGIKFRNRGGIYIDGDYREIRNIKIEYERSEGAKDSSGEEARDSSGGQSSAAGGFPDSWTIRAQTEAGELQFTTARELQPARVARDMIYYCHSFEGTCAGKTIRGSGYGEYLNI